MRFISKSAKFSLQVRPMIIEAYASGMQQVTQKPIYCDFQQGQLFDAEREYAMTQFAFEGGFQERDEVTMVDPIYRLSTFDTDEAQQRFGWTDAEREHVEQMLIDHSQRFTDIIRMPEAVIPPPWPRYDEYEGNPFDLVRKLVDDGHDLEQALAYERGHQKRQPVLDQIEQTLQEIESAEVVEEVIA